MKARLIIVVLLWWCTSYSNFGPIPLIMPSLWMQEPLALVDIVGEVELCSSSPMWEHQEEKMFAACKIDRLIASKVFAPFKFMTPLDL